MIRQNTTNGSLQQLANRLTRDPWIVMAVVLLTVLGLLIVWPQLWIARASLSDRAQTGVSLANFVSYFTTIRLRNAMINSVVISLIVALGACLVAVPLAFFHARYQTPGKSLIVSLVTMATISPPFLGAYAWVMLLGRNGIIMSPLRQAGIPLPFQSIMGAGGIIWVGIWLQFAIVFLLAYDAFCNLDPSLEEAAMSVGASRWRTYLQISLPLATPAVVTGGYMALMAAFADFGTPMIIGAGLPMLPVTIYYEFMSEVQQNPSLASAGSVIMVSVSTALLLIQRFLVARRSYAVVGTRRQTLMPLSRAKQALLLIWTGVVLLITFTPHIVVVITSFLTWRSGILKAIPTLDNYYRVFQKYTTPIYVSFFLSILSTVLDITVGVLIAYIIVRKSYQVLSPALNAVVMIPYIVPGTVLAIGLIVAFNKQPLLLTGTWVILALSYFIRRLPYAMKATEAALYQIHPALEEAALSVGASPARAFRDITGKLLIPAIVSGGTMTFLTIITELSSTIMLYAVPWITMTVIIFTNALSPGSPFGVASAMTVVLMVSVYVPLYLVRRYARVPAAVT